MRNLILILTLLPLLMNAQNEITKIDSKLDETVSITGNLNEGKIMNDLSWAWNSANACFPETKKKKFTGIHVLYETTIPQNSEMEVRVVPKDTHANFSIYAYQTGLNNTDVVPNLPNCIRCEVDYKWDHKWKGQTQDHTRTAKNLVSINKSFRVIIGVVGTEGLTEADYTLEIKTTSR
ncbi:MAG TPA: hypothetical protein EYG92_02140 [Lutibacter sp.]|nr:hypothetical protein [Lutibacter sp.]